MRLVAMVTAALLVFCRPGAMAQPLLADVFQDHAVLQQGRNIEVWGRAGAGRRVVVSLADIEVETRADPEGRWRANLPPLPAGGPHTLTARSDDGRKQTIRDVLVGDVWLCSGQSNMVLEIRRALDADSEAANVIDDKIRMLTIPTAARQTPASGFASLAPWRKAAPADAPRFSAVCYYFARELRKTTDIPIGLIVAAWGGSRIETWMSHEGLETVGLDQERLAIARLGADDPAEAAARWGEIWENWWRGQAPAGDEPWRVDAATADWRVAPGVGLWDHWGDPAFVRYTGLVWYRTIVTLSPAQAARKAMLTLGDVDEIDHAWVNGQPVGGGAGRARSYEIPPGLLRAGDNHIVVNVLNTWGAGGLVGPAETQAIRFDDGSSAALTGPWRIKKAPAEYGYPPRAPWEALAGVSMAYNGMVAPLAPYAVRGVLWYQGESNTGDADRYQAYLAGLMRDWRRQFGAELPFLVVQLAGFGPAPTTPQESGWAALREAQRAAVAADANAGLAVAIDIGDRYDIHPPNKQEVARRLFRAARQVVFGETIAPSGPVPVAARRSKNVVTITFADIEDGLVVYAADAPVGFEICDAARACRYAKARVDGDRVSLTLEKNERPARVRYCWADNPVCTLYDRAGLPAGPFEIAIE